MVPISNPDRLKKLLPLILFFAALSPLYYALGEKSFWSDELYSIFYALYPARSFFEEPHLVFHFLYLRFFVEMFGWDSPYLALSSLLPMSVALFFLYRRLLAWQGVYVAWVTVLTICLNPIVLSFSRSVRANVFMIAGAIFLWEMLEHRLTKKTQWIGFFFVCFILNAFFLVNILSLFIVAAVYWGYHSVRFENQDFRKKTLLMFTAALATVLCVVAKTIVFPRGFSSFHLNFELESLSRWMNYYFSFAEESFLQGLNFRPTFTYYLYLQKYNYVWSGILVVILGLNFWKFKDARRLQGWLLLGSLVYTVIVFLSSWMGLPVFLPRNHLLVFFLVQISLGLGLGVISKRKILAPLVLCIPALMVAHLNALGFYKDQPRELEAMRFGLQSAESALACDYGQKYQLLLGQRFDMVHSGDIGYSLFRRHR